MATEVFITKADLVATCKECGEPMCGSYDSEELPCEIKCVNCSSKYLFDHELEEQIVHEIAVERSNKFPVR